MRPKLNLKSKSQMPLSHEHVGSKILAKIKMYTLTRAELLFNLCYEIPCSLPKSGWAIAHSAHLILMLLSSKYQISKIYEALPSRNILD